MKIILASKSPRRKEILENLGIKFEITVSDVDESSDEKDPARLVFNGKAGKAIVVSLVDMGGRLRLICQDIECVAPIMDMPNLPVARVMWRPLPDLLTGIECWITAGGAHHTVLSYDVTAEQMKDFANMMQIEFVHITKDTTVEALEEKLMIADLVWKLK
jgi:L-arabinose isomerase